VFESFHSARRRTGRRAVPWIAGGVIVHAAIVLAAWIASLWAIEKLDMPRGRIRIAGAIGAPPPPPPPAAVAPSVEKVAPKKTRVTERVQPVEPEQVQPEPPAEPPAVEPPPVEPVSTDADLVGAGAEGQGDGLASEVLVRDSLATGPEPLGRYDKLVIDAPDERSEGLHGAIVLLLDIDAHGKVLRAELSEGMGAALDMQAMQLSLKFRFKPARDDDGTPIPSRVRWVFHVHPQPKTS
jgi:TonB family protein